MYELLPVTQVRPQTASDVRISLCNILIGVRAEARRPYGMKSDFVKGQQQLLGPYSQS
jgi:hypothetical protein